MEGSVLVLNSLYQAIQITGTRRAFRLFCSGRAVALSTDFRAYDFENWCDLPYACDVEVIRTPTRVVRVPSVIQLVKYDRVPQRGVRFTRRNVFFRDRNRCQYCGQPHSQRELNLDHVVPLSRGGKSTWLNVVVACIGCNSRKGSRTPTEAGMKLVRSPIKPTGHSVLRPSWATRLHAEWRTFLDEAYWNVDLSDDVVPSEGEP